MATYEGKWRCLRCSTVNLGRNLHCSSCGVKRDDAVEFFLDDDAPAVIDERLLQLANAGADWICEFCGGSNRADQTACSSCGNARDGVEKQLEEETREVNEWSEAAQNARATARKNAISAQNLNHAQSAPRAARSKFAIFGAGAIAAVVIALFGVFVYVSTATRPATLRVVGLEWQRKIRLEEYKTVRETAWAGEVPPNARVQSQKQVVHHVDKVPSGTRAVPETYTERVADGTETYSDRVSDGSERYVCGKRNKKNGFFEDVYCTRTKYKTVQKSRPRYKTVTKTRMRAETVYRDVPVYRALYEYLVDKWIPAGEETTSGSDFNPAWANVPVDNVRLRESGRTENYVLVVQNTAGKNEIYKYKLKPENWAQFKNGMPLHGKVNFYGNLISIEELPNNGW